jgi:hypothetical protein
MSEPSPLAKEIASVILEHLSWQDLIELAVEQMPPRIEDTDIMNKVRQAKYKRMVRKSSPIPISKLNLVRSYIVHIDGEYRSISCSNRFFGSCYNDVLVNPHTKPYQIYDSLSLYTNDDPMKGYYHWKKRNPDEYKIYPYK